MRYRRFRVAYPTVTNGAGLARNPRRGVGVSIMADVYVTGNPSSRGDAEYAE
jgi:hypothetical protein